MSDFLEVLPKGWCLATLDEIALWSSGGTPSRANPRYYSGNIPWIKTGELGQPLIVQTEEYISLEGLQNSSAKLFPKNSVALAMYGATIGKVSVLGIEAATNQACAVGIPDAATHMFLYYYLLSQNQKFIDAGKGGAQPNISQHIVKSWPVFVPPINEQNRIVEKLEELLSDLDYGVAELKAAQTKLTQYRQSLLKSAVEGSLTQEWREANAHKVTETGEQLLARILKERREHWEQQKLKEFTSKKQTPPKDWKKKYPEPVKPDTGDLLELPEGWIWASVDQLVAGIEAGKSFKCLERPPQGNDFGVLKVSAVTWGEYNEEESKTCLNKEYENPKILISEGDFLFSRANTTELVGACVIAKKVTKKIMLSDKIWRVLFVEDALKYWTLQCLRGPHGRTQIELSASGNQASMKNISQEKLKCFSIPIAPIEEMHFIESELGKLFNQIDVQIRSNVVQLKQADAQRKNILKDAFSGNLVPQNPNDEPARVLLEKIKAERITQAKQPKPNKKKEPSMNKLDAAAVKKWVSQQTEAFTFAQLQSVFNGDYETLKDIVFDILQEEQAVIRQVFNKESQHMMLEKA